MQNRTMPSCAIIPVLGYFDIEEAIPWLVNNFGFTERWRAGHHRAQLGFNGSTIALTRLAADAVFTRFTLLVRVDNLETHYRRALQQQVRVIQEPADYPYGERQYTAVDLNGHVWTFSQSIKDCLPEDWGGISGTL